MKYLLPDRFEKIKNSKKDLSEIIVPIRNGIIKIAELREYMDSNLCGVFLLLKGESGEGKTTFLNTLDNFIDSIEIITIDEDEEIPLTLKNLRKTKKDIRLIILEGRESYNEVSFNIIESMLRSINKFTRSDEGVNTIVVWPLNGEDMVEDLINTSKGIGGSSLLSDENIYDFKGPGKKEYIKILKSTFMLLNDGASINSFGVSDKNLHDFAKEVDTIGEYFHKVEYFIRMNKSKFNKATQQIELNNVWIVVIAHNDPANEIMSLTKGKFADIEYERLLHSTDANIAIRYRDDARFAILVNEINAKLLMIPSSFALDIIKNTQNEKLKGILKDKGISINQKVNVDISKTMLSDAIRGQKIKNKYFYSNSDKDEFELLTAIASNNDVILNEEIGKSLLNAGLIYKYESEEKFVGIENRRTDLVCNVEGNYIRLEFMWRKSASEAEIAKYTIDKICDYGTAIDFL